MVPGQLVFLQTGQIKKPAQPEHILQTALTVAPLGAEIHQPDQSMSIESRCFQIIEAIEIVFIVGTESFAGKQALNTPAGAFPGKAHVIQPVVGKTQRILTDFKIALRKLRVHRITDTQSAITLAPTQPHAEFAPVTEFASAVDAV